MGDEVSVAPRAFDPGPAMHPEQRPPTFLDLAGGGVGMAALRAAPAQSRSQRRLVEFRFVPRHRSSPGLGHRVPGDQNQADDDQHTGQQDAPSPLGPAFSPGRTENVAPVYHAGAEQEALGPARQPPPGGFGSVIMTGIVVSFFGPELRFRTPGRRNGGGAWSVGYVERPTHRSNPVA